jgi:DNA-binding beta-propeller fold protein YncE
MKTWFKLTLIASVCGLVACGGSSNEPVLQGRFIDAPVEGLAYTSSSGISGVTDSNGTFNYTAGSTVTFSLEGIKLPPVTPSTIVTPMELVGANSPSDPAALAIARLLQSVDTDGNPENGISVSKAKLKSGATAPSNWASMDDGALENLLASASDLVKKEKALDHFAKQLSKVNPSMSLVGRYTPGASTAGIAEIIAYHENSKSLFITVDHAAEPTSFKRVNLSGLSTTSIAKDTALSANNLSVSERYNVATHVNDANFTAGGVQSLDVSGNLLAIAVQNTPKTSAGVIAFYRLADNGTPTFLKKVTVGNLPDGVMFSPDGKYLVVANEGELNTDFETTGIDPEGSISIIAINNGVPADDAKSVVFEDFNVGGSRHAELPATVRIGRPGAKVVEDLEPEYVAFSDDGKTAFVTMQENNAVVSVNVASGSINKIMALGFKDYGTTYKIAPSDRYAGTSSSAYNNPTAAPTLKNYPNLYGIYMPDGIATYTVGGKTYFLTANEGDDRTDFLVAQSGPNMPDSARFKDILTKLDATAFPASILDIIKTDQELGRLNLITKDAKGNFGDIDGDGDYDRLYVLGGRSFSIFDGTTGSLVYDSGEDFERIVYSDAANDSNSATLLKSGGILGRLDNKGPEPETVVTGQVGNQTYAFIGLERSSGIMMYNITDPAKPKFVQYLRNTSDLSNGDISPEGMKFIPASKSPTGVPLLVVGYEVTGSLSVFQIK